MEIRDIKQRLSIEAVLQHYGLKPNGNRMLHCPFHADKTPSMQVYPDTGKVYCFSSNCRAGGKTLDTIDFIMYKEELTKHQAIEKAKTLAGASQQIRATKPQTPQEMGRIAVLTKLFHDAVQNLKRSEKAKTYCKERGLDPQKLQMGYLSERFYQSWNEKLKSSAVETGLLKKQANGRISPVFRNCLLFAMQNTEGKPVSIYGRSITGQNHFYLKGRHQGLYPGYPEPATRILILTESIIDAASLLQIPDFLKHCGVLALYGTNGLTEEHKTCIQNLSGLEELIFMFDGDQAGRKAAQKYAGELHELLPNLKISQGNLPENEDINSLLAGHEPEVITHLIKERTFLFSPEKKDSNTQPKTPNTSKDTENPSANGRPEPQKSTSKLQVISRDKIIYSTDNLDIEVWGGIELANLHRLKLSLYLKNRQTNQSFRDDVNLYSYRSRKAFLQDASAELSVPEAELKATIDAFTREAEHYRLARREKYKKEKKPEPPELSDQEKGAAIRLLKSGKLSEHLKSAMQSIGLVGETGNGLLLFLIFLTRFFDHPLHALVHGSSGSGKTNLLKSVLRLVPEESRFTTTALTENVLYRPPYPDYWKNRILMIEDLDGVYKALLALREFMSNQYISKYASEPDPKTGRFHQVQLKASGPVVIAGATTKDKVYEDNSNRSYLLHVNESKGHQQQILDYQNKQAAGLIDTEGTETICRRLHNMQRVLNPNLRIINPFQPELKLPAYVFKPLRTNTHYITLIKSITFLHQYRREHKKDEKGRLCIETNLEDVALANELSKQSLLRKSDELSGQVRDFFESLKKTVKPTGSAHFTAKAIREKFRMHPMTFSRRVSELQHRGYIKQTGGNRKTGYEYEIAVWDDYRVLQEGLQIMDDILEKLWKRYPDGCYSKES